MTHKHTRPDSTKQNFPKSLPNKNPSPTLFNLTSVTSKCSTTTSSSKFFVQRLFVDHKRNATHGALVEYWCLVWHLQKIHQTNIIIDISGT